MPTHANILCNSAGISCHSAGISCRYFMPVFHATTTIRKLSIYHFLPSKPCFISASAMFCFPSRAPSFPSRAPMTFYVTHSFLLFDVHAAQWEIVRPSKLGDRHGNGDVKWSAALSFAVLLLNFVLTSQRRLSQRRDSLRNCGDHQRGGERVLMI